MYACMYVCVWAYVCMSWTLPPYLVQSVPVQIVEEKREPCLYI